MIRPDANQRLSPAATAYEKGGSMRVHSIVAATAASLLLLATGVLPHTALADADQVRLSKQYGVGYLPLMVMEDHKLIEKHTQALGLGSVKVGWFTFSGGSAANDALLSGSIDFAGGGIGSFMTLWDKTRGGLAVKSPGAVCSYPMYLNTTNPGIHSIKDFTAKDKIALPAVGISPQAVTLQSAAAQLWGMSNYKKLDSLTVSLGHPAAVQALLSGKSEVNTHFATPPFQYEELKDPRIHTVLKSYDVWGGPMTANIIWATSKFVDQNPKLYQAVVAALGEAIDWVNHHKREAAELYVAKTRYKGGVADILAMLNKPEIKFTLTPEGMMKFADFKHKTGTLKVQPKSWKDFFFSNVSALAGS
jgi:NitT/TauT family transport system substrate-binding protein